MLRSMYSGISGLKNFQTKLDVIGNNIANVNTYGFKKGRVTFKDAISQTTAGASTSTDTRGGTNAVQVGLGSSISSIDTVDTAGSLQNTSRTLDLGIQGDGYFIVKEGTNNYYTRAGNFYLDEEGVLVTGEGYKVQDINGSDIQLNIAALQSFSIAQNGDINMVTTGGANQVAATIALAKFSNPGGLEKAGNNLFQESVNSGAPQIGASGTDGRGTLSSGRLEMSNVDLSEEFTDMIVAQRGFQANTRIITTSDEILQELVNLKR
ncbi:flagellar basal body rod protein FlgG [Bacillus sp. FJAT-27916]|uniref:flagellar basal body rod protein FlgG n=1 Tax=Bacillus sp. FJAT-27916 TaxID=1679169 RepID=UPI0006714FB0|nr:flagellar basal body rod protein FlgG [Bacillus sp. FJAT-27916]KMY44999.1 flagellar basal body rod protein FlgG [Bacillus sp. FJAT-27916]